MKNEWERAEEQLRSGACLKRTPDTGTRENRGGTPNRPGASAPNCFWGKGCRNEGVRGPLRAGSHTNLRRTVFREWAQQRKDKIGLQEHATTLMFLLLSIYACCFYFILLLIKRENSV
jgi:hypothetical protein